MRRKKIPDFGAEKWKTALAGHEPVWRLHESLRLEIKKRWKRSVPFADELFDRREKAKFLGFGKGPVFMIQAWSSGMSKWAKKPGSALLRSWTAGED